MSVQRKRGQTAIVYPRKTITDSRNNSVIVSDMDNPITVRAAFIPQRSSEAAVAGQQEIFVVTMIVDADLPNVGLWSTVTWRGADWDVVSPPEYHHGTRGTRHVSIDLRKRP